MYHRSVCASAARHLALSTNRIEKIAGLAGLTNLEILSLSRNMIKKLDGVDPVAGNLKQLWMSYNFLERLVRPLCFIAGAHHWHPAPLPVLG